MAGINRAPSVSRPRFQDICQKAAAELYLAVHIDPVRRILLPQLCQLFLLKILNLPLQNLQGFPPGVGILPGQTLQNLQLQGEPVFHGPGQFPLKPQPDHPLGLFKLPAPF